MSKTRLLAYLALAGNTVLWGLAIPIVKLGFLEGLTPTVFLFIRFFTAAALSLPIILTLRHQPAVKRTFRHWPLVLLIEFLGNVLALYLLYEGVNRTSAVESSLIASIWPIFVILGGILFLREKETKYEWIGLILATIGTFLLVGRPIITNHLNGSSITGNLLVLGHDLVTAGYALLAKRYYKNFSLWAVTHLSFWLGGFAFIGLGAFSGQLASVSQLIASPGIFSITAILYMAIFGSILGLTLYLIGQNNIEASEASLFTYLQPVVAIPASILLLSETVQPIEIIAIIIIVFGVYLAEKR